jgi:predicted nuclease of restriction endonuclease-like (RecB) superfamily
MEKNQINVEFANWINELKQKVHSARQKIAFSINSQLLELYWEIGRDVDYKLKTANWGSSIIEKISRELSSEFPDIKGFSKRNIYAIRQWYNFYSQKYEFVPQAVAQIPWGHNRLIISKIKDVEIAEFYSEECLKNAWDRDTLEIQIKSNYYLRIGKSANNFESTLTKYQSKLANEALKDPYNFDFLGLQEDALEKVVEDELTKHLTKFLLELGKGFAFVGRQYKIEISENDYYIDMLFYHLELRAYVVIELKSGKFKPEYAGKLNFYLSAVDSQLKKEIDNPTIGILLCKSKDKIEAEYALRDINKPMGISEYKLTEAIPENIKYKLPTIEELEIELERKNNEG